MDFFARQETAHKHTVLLVFLFLGAVVGVIAAADLVMVVGTSWILEIPHLPIVVHQGLAITILVVIVIFTLRRLYQLRGGGEAIAKMVSARQVLRNASGLDEQRLLNVVDEMAIAAGVTVPSIWVMDKEKGINAFAAGYSPNQAVIVVTQGALTKLNREELQGVIGHEFGHILNGDMRLNVRLIGILAGIVVVGEAGLVVIRLGAEGGDSGALPIIALGALISAVGYLGLFCGRVIKAAVSREREFLADASSVQFTRNPDGLASALKKIRSGEVTGVRNAYAGEMSHMFFGQAFSAMMFADILATHPPIDQRLANITGRTPDALPQFSLDIGTAQQSTAQTETTELLEAITSGFDATSKTSGKADIGHTLLGQVGSAKPEHVEYATRLLAAMPASFRQSLNAPDGARCAVYAYFASDDAAVRAIQDHALDEAGDGSKASGISALAATLRDLGPTARLPVLALALPALRQMEQVSRDTFLVAVGKLVEADHEVTLAEFVIRTILRRQLSTKSAHAEPVRYRSIDPVKADALLLLATLARAGNTDPKAQELAFTRGANRLGLSCEFTSESSLAADAMSDALDRLRQLTPLKKASLVMACFDTAWADGKLLVPEVELMRTIGMAIDCPLPPMLETFVVE